MLSYARFEMTRVIRNPRFMLLVALVPVLLYLVGLRQGAGAAIGAAPAGVWFLSSALALGAVASALTSLGARLAAERASCWSARCGPHRSLMPAGSSVAFWPA
jgi:hypothetical protein